MRYGKPELLNTRNVTASSTVDVNTFMSRDAVVARATQKRAGWVVGLARAAAKAVSEAMTSFPATPFPSAGRKDFPRVVEQVVPLSADNRSFAATVGNATATGDTKVAAAVNAAMKSLRLTNLSDVGLCWTRLFPIAALPFLIPILGRRPKLSSLRAALEALNLQCPDLEYDYRDGFIHLTNYERRDLSNPSLASRVDDPEVGQVSNFFVPDDNMFFIDTASGKVSFINGLSPRPWPSAQHPSSKRTFTAMEVLAEFPDATTNRWCYSGELGTRRSEFDSSLSSAAPGSKEESRRGPVSVKLSFDASDEEDYPELSQRVKKRWPSLAVPYITFPDSHTDIIANSSAIVSQVNCKYKVTLTGFKNLHSKNCHGIEPVRGLWARKDVPVHAQSIYPTAARTARGLRGPSLNGRSAPQFSMFPAEPGVSRVIYLEKRPLPSRGVLIEELAAPVIFLTLSR